MGNLHGVKVYDNIMVGLLFCCLLVVIGVVNVSMASVGVGCWFGSDSVGLGWERWENGRGRRKEPGESGGAGVGFSLFDFVL